MSNEISGINGNSGINRQQGPRPSGPPPEIVSALKAGGATDAEIASITGPGVAQSIAAKYNISLPEPPQGPPQGNELGNALRGPDGTRSDKSGMKAKVDADLTAAGATTAELSAAQAQGFEGIKALADKYGVELPQPPENPDAQRQEGSRPSGPPPEIASVLLAGGATSDEIAAMNGPEDAQALAEKYNVSLPEPPQRPSQGNNQASTNGTSNTNVMQWLAQFIQSFTTSTDTSN